MTKRVALPVKTWRVWTRITGPQLPLTNVTIGNAVVGPDPMASRIPAPPSGLIAKPKGEVARYFTMTGPTMRAVSNCWVVVQGVRAEDANEAINKAYEGTVLPIVAAFSAGDAKDLYRAQPWGADNGTESVSSFSDLAATCLLKDEELGAARLLEVQRRVALLTKNNQLSIACEAFSRGIRYGDFIAGPLTEASSILAFYQAIEACAEVAPWVRSADYDTKSTEIATELRKQLDTKTLTKKKVLAIRMANQSLNRLDASYISLRIQNAATAFGLDSEWVERATELGKFRNSKLGHPNSLPLASQLREWHGDNKKRSAYALASVMLAAAFQYLQDQD